MSPRRGRTGAARLRLRRVFEATREEVFAAWTDPDELRRRFYPPGGSCAKAEIELRVGGRYRLEMRPPIGPTAYIVGSFLEVDPPKRLVYTLDWEKLLFPRAAETVVTVEFHERGRATEVVITHEGLRRGPHRAFHRMGWRRSLRRLPRLMER